MAIRYQLFLLKNYLGILREVDFQSSPRVWCSVGTESVKPIIG